MAYSSTVTSHRRTVRNVEGDDGVDVVVRRATNYNVYRGMSPTTSSRLEVRLRELEDALEIERDSRIKVEKELHEYHINIETSNERLELSEAQASQQSELARRREADAMKFKKDLELLIVQSESNEASLRKRNQDGLNELNDQLELLTRTKTKSEKDRQHLILEIDSISSQLDSSLKAKAHAESKLDSLDDQLRKLKPTLETLNLQNVELGSTKARLTQENFDLQRQIQDLESAGGALAKAKSTLQALLDDAKTKLEEESRERNTLYITLTSTQQDLEGMGQRLEEEIETSSNLRGQLGRVQVELTALRSKYDKEMLARVEELDDLKRRMNARIIELEGALEQQRSRSSKLEKEKNRLVVEIREITIDLENVSANNVELSRRLKSSEAINIDLNRRYEELLTTNQVLSSDNTRMAADLLRFKNLVLELENRCDVLSRDNSNLKNALHESESSNKDLTRQVGDLNSIRVQLEADRDSLANELADCRDALKDAQSRLEAAMSSYAQLKSDMEARLRERDNEIENLRRSNQRSIEELQRTIVELETRFKSEQSRLRKKYAADMRDLEIRLEEFTRINIELAKQNKGLGIRVKDLEVMLEEEHRIAEEAKQAVVLLERKRIALTTELDDVRALLETAERAHKNAEGELYEASSRLNELTISVTSLTTDKRRMEADISAMQADLDEAINCRRSAEERADRNQMELNRVTEELRLESDNYRNSDSLRKQLEVEVREITVRLEEAEQFAQREGKRIVAKLQARLRDLESEYELEQRRSRDTAAINRKLERALAEIRGQADEDKRVRLEVTEQVNILVVRIKTLKRQLEEAEEVVTITMNKYRKGQSMLEEAEHRADTAEKNALIRGNQRQRSMSLTRHVVRVVNM